MPPPSVDVGTTHPRLSGGFAFIQPASKGEAIEACKDLLEAAGDGTVETRHILEFAPQPA